RGGVREVVEVGELHFGLAALALEVLVGEAGVLELDLGVQHPAIGELVPDVLHIAEQAPGVVVLSGDLVLDEAIDEELAVPADRETALLEVDLGGGRAEAVDAAQGLSLGDDELLAQPRDLLGEDVDLAGELGVGWR